MKIRFFILITLMILLLALNACGGRQTPPTRPPTTPPITPPSIPSSTFTPVPTGSVAILVLDDFVDEITGDNITLVEYQVLKENFEKERVTKEDNCVYTTQGQAAIVGKGAAAIVGKGADGTEITLPAPHGVIVFNELSKIVDREKEPSGAPINVPVSKKPGEEEFGPGWDWIRNVDIYDHEGLSLALVGIDVSNYTTRTIASHLEQAISALNARGYSQFVINMSFVIMPCPDLTQTDLDLALIQADDTYLKYRAIIEADPDLHDLHTTLNDLGSVSNYVDEDGNVIGGVDALLRLAFNPDLGPVRLRSYYSSLDYSNDKFTQVLNDPLRSAVVELSNSNIVFPIAASGNDGLDYPYAPAMWNTVLSVGSPIITPVVTGGATPTPMATPRQLSSWVDNHNQTALFYTNSGEVVAEGCTTYTNTERIPGTSFAAPKLSYLAALYLLQGGLPGCTGSSSIVTPVPPLGYATEDGNWNNEGISTAAEEYCSIFPTAAPGLSCP